MHGSDICFLQDGGSFAIQTGNLIEVLKALKENFPSLKQISSYGRAQTMGRKSETEMKEIFDAGLNMPYCGIESGSDNVLETVRKGVTSDTIIQSSLKARQAGMKLMVFAILGLGDRASHRIRSKYYNDTQWSLVAYSVSVFLNWDGELPVCFLKYFTKLVGSSKPIS